MFLAIFSQGTWIVLSRLIFFWGFLIVLLADFSWRVLIIVVPSEDFPRHHFLFFLSKNLPPPLLSSGLAEAIIALHTFFHAALEARAPRVATR